MLWRITMIPSTKESGQQENQITSAIVIEISGNTHLIVLVLNLIRRLEDGSSSPCREIPPGKSSLVSSFTLVAIISFLFSSHFLPFPRFLSVLAEILREISSKSKDDAPSNCLLPPRYIPRANKQI